MNEIKVGIQLIQNATHEYNYILPTRFVITFLQKKQFGNQSVEK